MLLFGVNLKHNNFNIEWGGAIIFQTLQIDSATFRYILIHQTTSTIHHVPAHNQFLTRC